MDFLILLTYAAVAVAAFKLFRLPVNAYTLLTAALGGLGLLAGLLLAMNYNHPYTRVARFYYHTTPIVSEVRGKVTEVSVSDGQRVEAGDVLFKIDPTPFQTAVDRAEARLAAAKQRVAARNASVVAFEEAFNAADARRVAAEDTYERNKTLRERSAVAEADFTQSEEAYLSAVAQAKQANAELERSRLEAESMIDGVPTDVAEAVADLAAAELDLDRTVVRAPTPGTALQVFLRPGVMATPLPLKPVMVFQHEESKFFVSSFLQNNAQRIRQGHDAEVVFPAIPGRIFRGKVKTVGASVAQGQLQATGELIDAERVQGQGRINVVIEFDEDTFKGFLLPPGSIGEVAVLSDHLSSLAVMRRVLMRMKSWTNFVFSDGHSGPGGH